MSANRVAVAVLLAIATGVAYLPAFSCGFISFDDPGYVYSNRFVMQGISWPSWCYACTTFDCGNWHPLTWLSLELDTSLWGVTPFGYHFTNVILHVANVILLYLVLYAMTGRNGCSASVAALFALHPLHVESVAWIAERKDVLSAFFLLLTLLAYTAYASKPSWKRYLSVILLFVAGLLAKPMLVTLPILLLLVDGWPLNRINWKSQDSLESRFPRERLSMLILEKFPLFAIAFVDGLITIRAQRESMTILTNSPFYVRIGNAIYAYFWYLWKTFWPTHLTIYYPHPERDLLFSQVLCGIVSLALISAFVFWRGKTKPYLLFGWIWFIISLLPVIGLLQVGGQAYADRYSYIPHIGLMILIVWEFQSWLERTELRNWISVPIAVALFFTCGTLTYSQVSLWKSNETLWTHTINTYPDNYIGYLHLADLRYAESDYAETIAHLQKTLHKKHGLRNFNPDAYCMLGKSLMALNQPAEAEQYFIEALKNDEYHEQSLDGLAKIYRMQNRQVELERLSAQHIRALMHVLETRPNDAEKQFNLALLLARQGKFAVAIPHFQKAIELAPGSATGYTNLAIAMASLGRIEEAKANLVRAIELDPTLANAHFHLAEILEMQQDIAGAKSHYSEVLRLSPEDKDSRERLEHLSH